MKSSRGVILLRSIDMLPDPRVEKYVEYFQRARVSYRLVGWNRSQNPVEKQNTVYFHCPATFGAGMKNVLKLIRFNRFLVRTLKRQRDSYDVIHACDFDTVLAALYAKLRWKKRVIFDVFDWYSDSRPIPSKILRGCIHWLEKWALKHSDYVIICDSERVAQLPIRLPQQKLFVLPNIPSFKGTFVSGDSTVHGPIKTAYVGVFGEGRGIEDILKFYSSHPEYQLEIAGFGELGPVVERYAASTPNIIYHGKVDYSQSLEIMAQADMIWALYYKVNRNHLFAAPNKYYEGLFLGKPIVTTEGTSIGNKTVRYQTGFVIGETDKDIENLMSSVTKEQIEQCGRNARQLWDNAYAHYVSNFMTDVYSIMIN